MSPAMLDKYVAAAKAIASHAVLLPGWISLLREINPT